MSYDWTLSAEAPAQEIPVGVIQHLRKKSLEWGAPNWSDAVRREWVEKRMDQVCREWLHGLNAMRII